MDATSEVRRALMGHIVRDRVPLALPKSVPVHLSFERRAIEATLHCRMVSVVPSRTYQK